MIAPEAQRMKVEVWGPAYSVTLDTRHVNIGFDCLLSAKHCTFSHLLFELKFYSLCFELWYFVNTESQDTV
jgi:hypothetical protein